MTADTKQASLRELRLENLGDTFWDLPTPELYERAIRRREGLLSHLGPFVVKTTPYTGRLPKDKFLVREPSSENKIWWGEVNQPFEPAKFETLWLRVCAYLQGKDVFVESCYAGADDCYRVPIRVISERATGALFARTMFIRELSSFELEHHVPEFTVLHVPGFHADPEIDGTRSDAFVLLHFGRKLVLIGGTAYLGEMKKSVFTIMNYLLPQRGVLPMHCSANKASKEDDVAIFFGLSGTGKTTLSADPRRILIGDDEHGWSDGGVFNLEGGCYAKVIRLSREQEPEIYETTRRFGTILENVMINMRTRRINLNDDSITENTRAAYPISHIPNMSRSGIGGHPKNIIMLTCDAFGVLPPVARLTREQAMYHFLSGYTAKVAGTEAGVTEPRATFSPCFGAPFMALPPRTYAQLLGERITKHTADVWLINTGWTGGSYGIGQRIKLPVTRAIINAVLDGTLRKVETKQDEVFGLRIPVECPEVPSEILEPRRAWKDGQAYDWKARELAEMFKRDFAAHASDAPPDFKQAGPKG